MREKIKKDSDRAITLLRAKVKITEYEDEIFKDGFFNPICPSNYNFLTGLTEPRQEVKALRIYGSVRGHINGVSIYNPITTTP